MVQDQGIDVYLAPYSDAARSNHIGSRYREYAVPVSSPAFTNDPNDVWIEAVNGERFVIVVDLMEDFETKDSQMLRISVKVDGESGNTSSSYRTLKRAASGVTGLKGRHSSESNVRKVDGRWAECGYTFAVLQMDEEMEMDEDQVEKSVATHGKVVVTVQRGGRAHEATKGSKPMLWDGYCAPDTEVSSKAVVKDRHVSHAVKHTILSGAPQPRMGSGHWRKLPGQGGNIMKFTIRYRSRDALQKLKIVPKDKFYIDLTNSPMLCAQVKGEEDVAFIKQESPLGDQAMDSIEDAALDADSIDSNAQPPADASKYNDDGDTLEPIEARSGKRKRGSEESSSLESTLGRKKVRISKRLQKKKKDQETKTQGA